MRILSLCLMLFCNGNIFANTFTNIYSSSTYSIISSYPCLIDTKETLQGKPYECSNFKVGDKVTYSIYYVFFEITDFVGIVTAIEPKPTDEYIHWITVKKLSGKGTTGVYSEQFLTNYILKN